MIKKYIAMISMFVLLFSLNSCGIINSRTDFLESDYKSETEAIEKLENTVIEALENDDKQLLLGVFSEKALSKDSNIDEEMDYMFDFYKGEFIEITERNHSSHDHFDEDGHIKEISGWCDIKTTEGNYIFSYVMYPIQEHDATCKGVYSMELRDGNDKYGSTCFYLAGIETPYRESVHITLDLIFSAFDSGKVARFESILSSSITDNKKGKNSGDISCEVVEYFSEGFTYTDVRDGWIVTDDGIHVYVELYAQGKNYIMYFRYDTSSGNEDKIYLIKFTEIKEGTTLEDYELGENLTDPGIYLE